MTGTSAGARACRSARPSASGCRHRVRQGPVPGCPGRQRGVPRPRTWPDAEWMYAWLPFARDLRDPECIRTMRSRSAMLTPLMMVAYCKRVKKGPGNHTSCIAADRGPERGESPAIVPLAHDRPPANPRPDQARWRPAPAREPDPRALRGARPEARGPEADARRPRARRAPLRGPSREAVLRGPARLHHVWSARRTCARGPERHRTRPLDG